MKVLKWLDNHFEEFFLVVFLALITIVMTAQIVARVFGSPFTWSEELSRFLLVWSGFLSLSYCFKKQTSVKIDQIVDMLPSKVKTAVKIFEKIMLIAFYVYMLQFAFDYLNRAIQSGQLSPAMQIPMYLVQIAPLAGFCLAIIRLAQSLIDQFRPRVSEKPAQ